MQSTEALQIKQGFKQPRIKGWSSVTQNLQHEQLNAPLLNTSIYGRYERHTKWLLTNTY